VVGPFGLSGAVKGRGKKKKVRKTKNVKQFETGRLAGLGQNTKEGKTSKRKKKKAGPKLAQGKDVKGNAGKEKCKGIVSTRFKGGGHMESYVNG